MTKLILSPLALNITFTIDLFLAKTKMTFCIMDHHTIRLGAFPSQIAPYFGCLNSQLYYSWQSLSFCSTRSSKWWREDSLNRILNPANIWPSWSCQSSIIYHGFLPLWIREYWSTMATLRTLLKYLHWFLIGAKAYFLFLYTGKLNSKKKRANMKKRAAELFQLITAAHLIAEGRIWPSSMKKLRLRCIRE